MRDDLLPELLAFVAVAEARGFRGAAAQKRRSASSLSAAVRHLEDALETRLFHRTTRSVTLTEAGARLLERLRPALGEITAALDDAGARETALGGTLRLNVPTIVADVVLPEILAGFLLAHPGVKAEVRAEDGFVDVLAAGFDAGVRYGERLEQDMIAVPIGPREQSFVTAAAPALLARVGAPERPEDLLRRPAIRFRFAGGAMPDWEFARGAESVRLSPAPRLIVTRMRLAVAAAEAGLGFVHGFSEYLAPSVAAGRLVLVLEDWADRFPGPYLYYAQRRLLPPPLRAFVDYLKRL